MAAFDRCMDRSDPEVMRHYNKAFYRRLKNAKGPIPEGILSLCRSAFEYSEVIMYEVDETDDVDQ